MHNVHNQLKGAPYLMVNCIQENLARNNQPVTRHNYMTKMANSIIDEYTCVTMEYRHIIKIQNTDQFRSNNLQMI